MNERGSSFNGFILSPAFAVGKAVLDFLELGLEDHANAMPPKRGQSKVSKERLSVQTEKEDQGQEFKRESSTLLCSSSESASRGACAYLV